MNSITDEQIQTKLEQELLGAILCLDDKDQLYEIIDKVEPRHFYYDKHRIIYKAIVALFIHNNHIDLIMLATELKNRNVLDEIDGEFYLTQLQPSSYASEATEYRVLELLNQARLRLLENICQTTLQRLGKRDFENVSELIEPMSNDLYEIEHNRANNAVDIEKVGIGMINKARALKNGEVFGLSWGLNKLDFLTSGIELKKSYVVGGTKKTGKTKFVINTMHAVNSG